MFGLGRAPGRGIQTPLSILSRCAMIAVLSQPYKLIQKLVAIVGSVQLLLNAKQPRTTRLRNGMVLDP